MTSIRDQDEGYRRGLVLGLTMAEIIILVIFVLLLVLSTLFERQSNQIAVLESKLEKFDRFAKTLGRTPEQLFQEVMRESKRQRPLVLVRKEEIKRLEKLERTLTSIRPASMGQQPLPELFRELVLLRDATIEAGVKPTSEALQRALVEGAEAKKALDAIPKTDPKKLTQENARLSRENERLRQNLRDLQSQLANFQRQTQSGGRGLEHRRFGPLSERLDVALACGSARLDLRRRRDR